MENGVGISGDEVHSRLVQWYESAEWATMDGRQLAERDRDYVNHKQWTDDEVATLQKRKQPVVTINRIAPKIEFLKGMESQNRRKPKAYPRTPKEEQGAEAATDAISFVMDRSRWDRVRSECFDEYLVEGECAVDVRVYPKGDDYCIDVLQIRWDRMFYDPHGRRRDYKDCKFKGQYIWLDLEDARAMWPGKDAALAATVSGEHSGQGETFDDVPRLRWADSRRQRVRVVSMWTREGGKVFYSEFTKGGMLSRMESPFKDEDGNPDDGFVFGSCYIDRDGVRYGVARGWISLQDEINKRRSKALHLLNVRQTYGNQAAGDKNKLRAEMARPDGHIEMQGGAKYGEDFGVIPTGDLAAAQFEFLRESKAEIDSVGVNAALSGTEARVMSGRALMQRSEQGMNELGPVFDGFKQWQLDVYRMVWNRIRQFWTKQKWIRVTDDERNIRFVGLNQPMTLGEQLLEEAKAQGQEVTPEMMERAQSLPEMQQIVGTRNNVSELDVDLVVDDAPSSASIQIEQFEQLAKMATSGVPIPPEVLIEASQLRNKDRIIEMMKGEGQIPPQVQMQMQKMQEMLQAMGQQLQQAEKAMNDKAAEYQLRAREIDIKAYDAETKRGATIAADEAAKAAHAASLRTSSDVDQ